MKLLRFLLGRPFAVILLFSLILAAALPGLLRIRFTTDMADYFMEDDPILTSQDRFEKLFGSPDFIAVLLESEDVFSFDSLETIHRLGELLREEVPFADSLVSLTAVNSVISGGKSFRFEDGELLTDAAGIEELRESFGAIESFKGTLYSADETQAWILLNLSPYPSPEEWNNKATPQFHTGQVAYEIITNFECPEGIDLTASGLPVYAHRKEAEMLGDFLKILVIGAAVSVLMTTIILQNLHAITGTLLVIINAVVSVFGMYGWNGKELDNAFMAVPILLTMGLSIGYTVHITHFFTIFMEETGNRKESVIRALEQTWRPILFTVMTTSAAMLTFLIVEIEPIRWVGYTSSLCLILVFLLSMTLFPAVMSLGRNAEQYKRPWKQHLNMEPFLDGISSFVATRQKLILSLFLAVTALALWGITRVEVDFNAEKMMGLRLPHMQDQMRVSRSSIGSTEFMDLTISLPEGEFRKAETLEKLEAFQEDLETLPLVTKTTSLTANIREFNRIFHKGKARYELPASAGELRALFNLAERLSPRLLRDWVDEGYGVSRVRVELSGFSSKIIEQDLQRISELFDRHFSDGGEFFFSGSTYQMALMNQYVTRGLVSSILISLLLITVLMVIVFKSVRLGLIAMIPNVFPILICGAIMGFAGIPLEFVTMTVAPLIMGLAVDDTIHFISYMKKGILEIGDYAAGIRHSFKVVGTAISQTTVILCLTFLVFCSSDVNSLIFMGVLTFWGMLAAYLADIFITPILITKARPFDLKTVKSKERPLSV